MCDETEQGMLLIYHGVLLLYMCLVESRLYTDKTFSTLQRNKRHRRYSLVFMKWFSTRQLIVLQRSLANNLIWFLNHSIMA